MTKDEVEIGKEYALQQIKKGEVERVRVLGPGKKPGSWRVEWLDGKKEGMTFFVQSTQLVSTWKSYVLIEADERRAKALHEHNLSVGYEVRPPSFEDPEAGAIGTVFDATGEPTVVFNRGTLIVSPAILERIQARAKSEVVLSDYMPPGYLDRGGKLRLPYDFARALAKEFCLQEPVTVLTDINAEEAQTMYDIEHAGQRYLARLLTRHRAEWALVKQWAGPDAAIIVYAEHIQRLQLTITAAARALDRAGLHKDAERARKALTQA